MIQIKPKQEKEQEKPVQEKQEETSATSLEVQEVLQQELETLREYKRIKIEEEKEEQIRFKKEFDRKRDLEEKNRLVRSINFTGQGDEIGKATTERLATQTRKQGTAISVMEYFFDKYELPEMNKILNNIILYSSYNKNSVKSLIEFKEKSSLFDLFRRGGGSIRKDT